MAIAISNLEMYYIDIESSEKKEKSKNPVKRVATAIVENVVSVRRFVDDMRFNVITSEEELDNYVNANGNSWIINDKSLKKRQYYIRHPKKSKENVLIEANDFYRYIEEEQKEELVEFILAHCPAKEIEIERKDKEHMGGGVDGNIGEATVKIKGKYDKNKENYYINKAPWWGRLKKVPAREEYYWLDKSLMTSIKGMKKGQALTQTYKMDFECGLSVSEITTIGLDINMHKKFSYTIYIKC